MARLPGFVSVRWKGSLLFLPLYSSCCDCYQATLEMGGSQLEEEFLRSKDLERVCQWGSEDWWEAWGSCQAV